MKKVYTIILGLAVLLITYFGFKSHFEASKNFLSNNS